MKKRVVTKFFVALVTFLTLARLSGGIPALAQDPQPGNLCYYRTFTREVAAVENMYPKIQPSDIYIRWTVIGGGGSLYFVKPFTPGAYAAAPVTWSHGSIVWLPVGVYRCLSSEGQLAANYPKY